ncbi:FliH/SctL family protein [Sulfitobacter sp. 20_GPM-1509m]|uniref:FliH/SctL family protein n=1 Tax=Sulfitobacter sp. 20_GPM-1509m TaxID=1380367 RepID=UPI00048B79AE|nr:FliH/SctL family protein [Sulfitobacter sp. 20_GPM-1509m]
MKVTRVQAATLDQWIEDDTARQTASRDAEAILVRARAEANRITAEAERRAAARLADLSDLSDKQLETFIDKTRLEAAAKAMRQFTAESGRLTERFDALGPWVAEIVETILTRILDTLPKPELFQSMVARALSEARADWELSIRAAPSSVAALRAAICNDTGRPTGQFTAIREIISDPRLSDGTVLLVSGQGAVDLSIETQIDAFTNRIRETDRRNGIK